MYVFGASNIFETIPFCWVLWICEGRAGIHESAYLRRKRRAKVSRQIEFYTALHLSLQHNAVRTHYISQRLNAVREWYPPQYLHEPQSATLHQNRYSSPFVPST